MKIHYHTDDESCNKKCYEIKEPGIYRFKKREESMNCPQCGTKGLKAPQIFQTEAENYGCRKCNILFSVLLLDNPKWEVLKGFLEKEQGEDD